MRAGNFAGSCRWVGDSWEGFIKCSRPKGWSQKIGLFLNKYLEFLCIKCPNLHSQKKKSLTYWIFPYSKFLKRVVTI